MTYVYNFFLKLKELEVHKVPIFTRLNSFKHVLEYVQLAKYQDRLSCSATQGNNNDLGPLGLSNGIVAPT